MFQAATFSNIGDSRKRNLTPSSAGNEGLCLLYDELSGGEQSRAAVVTAQCYSYVSFTSICVSWFFILMPIAFMPQNSCSYFRRDICYLSGKRKNPRQPLYLCNRRFNKTVSEIPSGPDSWKSPIPHKRHFLISFILLAFMFPFFCPLYASTLLIFLFFSNVCYACLGLPLEKPCLLL